MEHYQRPGQLLSALPLYSTHMVPGQAANVSQAIMLNSEHV